MDFHFVPDPKQNLEHILNCWELRKRTYKEKWLLLYEHYFTIQDVLTSLKNATMDFDDDFIIGINKTRGSFQPRLRMSTETDFGSI